MADTYLPGPDPIFFAPDLNASLEAENALSRALANNRDAGANVSGISAAQADTLMSWVVDNARNALVEKRAKRTGVSSYDDAFTAESVRGRCGLGQALCSLQAETMGMDSQTHQIFKLSPEPGLSHVFSVMNVPVQTPEGVSQKSFLVDTTFRQFFTTETDHFAGGGSQPGWGFQLAQTEEGKQVADALLTKGFIELTPERAALYIGSQSFANKTDDIATAVHAPPAPQDAFNQLVASSSTELDFDIDELADLDLRTPSLVAQQAPRSAVIGAHQQQTGAVSVRSVVRETVERPASKENRLAGELKQALASHMKPGSILGVRHEEGAYVVTVPADLSRSEFGKAGIPDPTSLVRSAATTQGHDITIPESTLNRHYHVDTKATSPALEQARDVGRGPLALAMSASANTPASHDAGPRIGTPPPRQR